AEQITVEHKAVLETSQTWAEHAAQLITELLSLGKEKKAEAAPINIGQVVKETVRILQTALPQSIQINTSIPADLHSVPAKTTQLSQLLLNLCLNARDAMPSGGTLT